MSHSATIVAHADWSVDARKRWVAMARREEGGWRLAPPMPVGDVATFLARLRSAAHGGAVALGVDLPIGLPRAYAASLPERDFLHFLATTATRPDFFQVCATLAEVRPERPFYPARGVRGMTRAAHAAALGLDGAAALSRACDRATAERPAGAPLFWTLGANQSGKAAIAAWQAVLLPALASGEDIRLWPFAGAYLGLLTSGSVAVAETYPAEALRHLGIRLKGSKRRQADRAMVADQLAGAMAALGVLPDSDLRQAAADGFGDDAAGEDRFDCVLGALCVVNVLAGNRPDSAPADPWIQRWEGWVLGQTALPAEKKRRASLDAPKLLSVTKSQWHRPARFDKTQERMTTTGWKGLDTGRMPVFLGYDQTERMVAALLDRAARWQPEVVVGIARGGLVPASMAAGILALPLSMIGFERVGGATRWLGAPADGGRVLLVDDGCSTGRTMDAVRAALLREGRACLTLAVVHDPDVTTYVPDLSHAMRALWRFPWERGEATPAGRALRATGAGPDRATELPFYGLDLDGVFLPDVPDEIYRTDIAEAVRRRHGLEPFATLPFFAPERAVVITGRPDSDRERTQAWLTRWGHGALPLECRPAHIPHNPDAVARHKAETATLWGCTHFIESDAEQALRVAAHAPHLVVSWWSATEARAWLIGVAAQPA